MITAYATVENAVAAFRRGAQDYLMKPVLFEDLLAKLDRLIALSPAAAWRTRHCGGSSTPQGDLDALVGGSPPMQAVKTLIRKVGPTRSTVLITGESGTGKELVARALHALGPGAGRAVPGDQLRGDPARPAREPALRPRPGRLHRRRPRPRRPVRRRRAGDGLPRRDRRAVGDRPRRSCSARSRTRRSCRSARPARSRSRPG